MFVLKIIGARRSTLAYHTCVTMAEVEELKSVYRALGYEEKSLVVEEREMQQAA